MKESNLKKLRKTARLTQEQVAEKLNVSRQSVAKWESGDALPDIDNCIMLARLYNVTIDDLVGYAKDEKTDAPSGKHMFGVVKIDSKKRIVIPEKVFDVFDLKTGDKLLMMGDEGQGLAMVKLNSFLAATAEIMKIIQETDSDEEDE
ncbi:MAG: helix-turn-helix domain-containing protein [Ruminiclostridium sp.]|nr:helix-turn-helix domain-containing protein [Ruminiclostridium sp.]